ncbi:MAG: TolC family protein [Bacillota bacterium]|nr:TolC family protein [Bacillota bacterium]
MLKKLISLVLITCFGLSGPGVAWAGEATPSGLTLNQAIAMAVKYSIAAQKAELEIDRAESSYDKAEDRYDTVVEDVYSDGSDMDAAWAAVLQADLSRQKAKKNYDAALDDVTLKACQLYWGILEAQEKVAAAEAAVKKAELDLGKTRIVYDRGLVSKYGSSVTLGGKTVMSLDAAEKALLKAQGDLDAAKNGVETAYIQFDQLVGLSLTDRPALADDVEFSPLAVDNLEAEVNRVLDESPSVWIAEQNAKYTEDLSYWNAAEDEEVEQAELDVKNAKDAVRLQMRNLYYTLQELERSYALAEKNVAVAEADLRVKQILQRSGLATAAEVTEAETALAEARLSLKQTAIQYAYNKRLFEKPWAASYS